MAAGGGAVALATGGGRLAAAGFLAAATALIVRWRTPADPGRWSRGSEGEVATARLLARLPRRFVVLHDRRPRQWRGNLDHLVFGPSGVWVIDSKARRARLRVSRGQVWAGRHAIDVASVSVQAAHVGDQLGVAAVPLVVVHGRGLRGRGKKVAGVRVVPARRLNRRLRRGRRLPPADVDALAARADRLFPPA
jgi:hypothetical protein